MLFYILSVLGLVPTFQKTKCKKLLNITMERIKMLENRRKARFRQLEKDVIELRQLKKEDKIDPWLLRIWKELCLFSVYIKIGEYCAFVQINLKDIAGQRECPSGLEEPIAGLCFAASCCADLPELQELREIFAMKYGKQFLSSGQDLQPNCHVNKQFLNCLCAKDPSAEQKQAILEDITPKKNVTQGHEQDTQHEAIHDSLTTEHFVDANECKQSQEAIDCTMKEPEVKDQFEREELHEVDVEQASANCTETVHEEDLSSMDLANELANRKRTIEVVETRQSACKKASRRRKLWQNKTMDREENGGDVEHEQTTGKGHDSRDKHGQGDEFCSDTGKMHHDGYKGCGALQGEGITTHMNEDVASNEDLQILHYIEQPLCSHPPQRPPPTPPPKRAPPTPPSLRVSSMPSSGNDHQVNANTNLPLHCATMANNYYLETYGSHVHPRLPKYEDLVTNFTALKR